MEKKIRFNNLDKKNRPRITIIPEKRDKILEVTAVLLLATFWLFIYHFYNRAPAQIPMHFDALGNPNRFGAKSELFFLPGLSTILYVILSVLMKYPHTFNYPVEITEKNAEYQYRLGVTLIRLVKINIVIVFFLVTLFLYYSAFYGKSEYSFLLLPIIISLTLAPIVTILIKMSKN